MEYTDEPKLTPQRLVKILDKYLFGWEFHDIEKASIKGSAKLAGFILGACFIDAMAGFYGGVTRATVSSGSGTRFKDFVSKYLSQYNSDSLWKDLRCGLVHSYAEGGTYVFTHANKAGKHFNQISDGRIILNLEDFLNDLSSAYKKLSNDILNDRHTYANALKRFNSMGLMVLIKR